MNEDFFLIQHPANNPAGYCTVDELDGFENEWEVGAGYSLVAKPPEKLTMSMYADEPRNTVLPDYVQNMKCLLIVSPRMKSFLEAQELHDIEYYPLEIKDHKGKVASDKYFVAHLINPVECIDVEASGAKWRAEGSKTQRIVRVQRLVLDSTKIPAEKRLFFLRYFNDFPIIRRDLAELIRKEGFSNIEFMPVSEYEYG